MVELDHQKSVAKTLVINVRLNTSIFFLSNLFDYCRFA